MSVLIYRDRPTAGAAVATVIASQLIEKPSSILCLDVAEEARPIFRALSKMTADGLLDWSDTRIFSLAEYVGASDSNSIRHELQSLLTDHVNIDPNRLYSPLACAKDWCSACNDYEESILRAGGIDLLYLTIKADGSIAFNSGALELAPVTHVEATENGRVTTVGIGTIMNAKKIIAYMVGEDKASIAEQVCKGAIMPQVPATYLQLHANTVFILDEAAARRL